MTKRTERKRKKLQKQCIKTRVYIDSDNYEILKKLADKYACSVSDFAKAVILLKAEELNYN